MLSKFIKILRNATRNKIEKYSPMQLILSSRADLKRHNNKILLITGTKLIGRL
jgi:hypothetical protein